MTTIQKHQIWVKIDFWTQVALLVATAGLSVFHLPIFLFIMAIWIGFWQVIGALIHLFVFKKTSRIPYLLSVLAFGAILFAIGDDKTISLIIPLSVWSLALTFQDIYNQT